MQQNLQTLRNRVDELGVAEPVITGKVKTVSPCSYRACKTRRSERSLGRTAALELRAVDDKSNSRAAIRRAKKGRPPAGTELFLSARRRTVVAERGNRHQRRKHQRCASQF